MCYQRLAMALMLIIIIVLIALVGCSGGTASPTAQSLPPTITPTATPADPRILTLEVELIEGGPGPMVGTTTTRNGGEPVNP
ncbi:MAG: hypothetical protein HC884_02485 [Chloroflexaceae bacterium]|nr:hypothetical protein [Chloroflexaceae bacterium]